MPEQPGAGRLDPETLAAYVDGLLPPEERAKVDAEIAADPETYEWLVNTINAMDDDSIQTVVGPTPSPAPAPGPLPFPAPHPIPEPLLKGGSGNGRVLPFYRRRSVMAGAGVVLAAAASLLLVVQLQPEWWQQMRGPQVDPRFATLVAAVGEERYIEARLTGGFKYGPLRPVMRGTSDLSRQNLELLAAAGELQRAASTDPTPDSLHAWGVAQLLLGRSDGAIDTLEAAHVSNSSAEIAADLAAALLARARATGQRADAEEALRLLDALTQDPLVSKEALFNRAVALDALGETEQAPAAWRAAAEADPASPWAREAQQRMNDPRLDRQ